MIYAHRPTKNGILRQLSVLMFFLAVSCALGSSEQAEEIAQLPAVPMNTLIELSLLTPGENYRSGDEIWLNISSISSQRVNLGKDFGIEIFSMDPAFVVSDRNTFLSQMDIVLNTKGQLLEQITFFVVPVVEPINTREVPIRITLKGFVAGDPEKPVGAYIDVVLLP